MAPIRVLLAGASWVSLTSHFKGFDFITISEFETGLAYLRNALATADIV